LEVGGASGFWDQAEENKLHDSKWQKERLSKQPDASTQLDESSREEVRKDEIIGKYGKTDAEKLDRLRRPDVRGR